VSQIFDKCVCSFVMRRWS